MFFPILHQGSQIAVVYEFVMQVWGGFGKAGGSKEYEGSGGEPGQDDADQAEDEGNEACAGQQDTLDFACLDLAGLLVVVLVVHGQICGFSVTMEEALGLLRCAAARACWASLRRASLSSSNSSGTE